MTERPNDPGITSGDPLAPGPDAPPDPSGLPGYAAPPAPSDGYSSQPPPGAFGDGSSYAATAVAPAAGRYALASWWSRVGAALIDGLIVSVGALAILLVFGSVASVGFFASDETGIGALIVSAIISSIAIAIVAFLYAPLMMARTNGKTLGRMALGIRVVRAGGEQMTFGFAMLREVAVKVLLFGIAGSFTFGLVNLADALWPLWDDENRALHDFVVNTRVVRD